MTDTVPTCTKPRAPRKKPTRTARYHRVNSVYGTLEMTFTTARTTTVVGYHIESIPSDFGRAFNVRKYASQVVDGEPTSYDVLLDITPEGDATRSSCECKGFIAHHHCRHLEALLALVWAGKL